MAALLVGVATAFSEDVAARPLRLALVGHRARHDLDLVGCREAREVPPLVALAGALHALPADRFRLSRGGLFARRGPQWLGGNGQDFGAILAALQLDAGALDNDAWALLPPTLDRLATGLRAAGAGLQLDNLRCEAERGALCTEAGRVVQRGGLRLGWIVVQLDDPAYSVDPAARRGLRLIPAADAALHAARRLAAERVDAIVVLALRGAQGHASRDVAALAEALLGHVDVVLTDALGGDAQHPRRLHIGADEAATHLDVVGLAGAGTRLDLIDAELADDAPIGQRVQRLRASVAASADRPTSAAMLALHAAARARWCEAHGQPRYLGHGDAGPLRAEILGLLVAAVRRDAAADAAILPHAALRPGPARYRSGASLDDLAGLTAGAERVVRAELSGQALHDLLTAVLRHAGGATVAGLDQQDGEWLLHGLPLDTRLHYQVAMTETLAQGLAGAVPPSPRYALVGRAGHHALLESMLRGLDGRHGEISQLRRWLRPRARWELFGTAWLAASGARATGAGTARDPRLNEVNAAALALRVEGLAWLHNRVHGWQSRVILDLEQTRSLGTAATSWITADELRLESGWAFGGLRRALGGGRFAPMPLLALRGRTELAPAAGAERLLDGDAVAGVRWQPRLRLRLDGAAGARWTRTGDLPTTVPLAMLAGRMLRSEVATLGPLQIDADAELDARWLDPRGEDRVEVEARGGLWLSAGGQWSIYAVVEWLRIASRIADASQWQWQTGLSWSLQGARRVER